jgi:hypothetical protein
LIFWSFTWYRIRKKFCVNPASSIRNRWNDADPRRSEFARLSTGTGTGKIFYWHIINCLFHQRHLHKTLLVQQYFKGKKLGKLCLTRWIWPLRTWMASSMPKYRRGQLQWFLNAKSVFLAFNASLRWLNVSGVYLIQVSLLLIGQKGLEDFFMYRPLLPISWRNVQILRRWKKQPMERQPLLVQYKHQTHPFLSVSFVWKFFYIERGCNSRTEIWEREMEWKLCAYGCM